MKLERIPKYRIPLADDSHLTVERDDDGWHIAGGDDTLGNCLFIPHAAVGLLVEALTTDIAGPRHIADPGLADFVLGKEPATKSTKALWTYSTYRATLYRDGERFAMVTPDGSNALSTGDMAVLLEALNGSSPIFNKVFDSPKTPDFPDIKPDPGYRRVEVGEVILKEDLWKGGEQSVWPVVATAGQPLEPATTAILQRRVPDAVAAGHNPDKLTNAQVGVYDGWRLLTEKEVDIYFCKQVFPTEFWAKLNPTPGWCEADRVWGITSDSTIRTKAAILEVVS